MASSPSTSISGAASPASSGDAAAVDPNALVGDTPEGRDAYTRVAGAWIALEEWWKADDDHHGLSALKPAFDRWHSVDQQYNTRMSDLLTSKSDLESAIADAVAQGYQAGDTDWLGQAWDLAMAPFRVALGVAKLPYDAGVAAANALGVGGDGSGSTAPLIPSWAWWAGGAVGVFFLYKAYQAAAFAGRAAVQAAPVFLPAFGVPPTTALALQQALGQASTPSPAATNGGAGDIGALIKAFGQRGSAALEQLAQMGRLAGTALGIPGGAPASNGLGAALRAPPASGRMIRGPTARDMIARLQREAAAGPGVARPLRQRGAREEEPEEEEEEGPRTARSPGGGRRLGG